MTWSTINPGDQPDWLCRGFDLHIDMLLFGHVYRIEIHMHQAVRNRVALDTADQRIVRPGAIDATSTRRDIPPL